MLTQAGEAEDRPLLGPLRQRFAREAALGVLLPAADDVAQQHIGQRAEVGAGGDLLLRRGDAQRLFERRFDLVVRLAQEQRQSIDDVRALFVALPGGGGVCCRAAARPAPGWSISWPPSPAGPGPARNATHPAATAARISGNVVRSR